MSSATEERWKNPNVEISWVEQNYKAGWTSFRRMAMKKVCICCLSGDQLTGIWRSRWKITIPCLLRFARFHSNQTRLSDLSLSTLLEWSTWYTTFETTGREGPLGGISLLSGCLSLTTKADTCLGMAKPFSMFAYSSGKQTFQREPITRLRGGMKRIANQG
jgi:hypothetical protein